MKVEQLSQPLVQEKNSSIKILTVSIPVALSQFLLTLGGFVSAFFLSFLGTKIFAASMIFSSTQLLFLQVPFAMLFCISPIVSHIVGSQQNLFQVGVLFRASLVLSLLLSILIMLMLSQIKPILLLFNEPIDLANISQQYFRWFLWVVPLSAMSRVCFQIAMGLFKQKMVFQLSIANLIFFTVVGYVLIFGKLWLPAMGIKGLALAYIFQSLFNLAFLLIYFSYETSFKPFKLFNLTVVENLGLYFKKILGIGTPITLQMGNELLSFFITTLMVGHLGMAALIAKQISVQYLLLLVIPLFGIGQASATFVAKFLGMKQYEQMKFYGDRSLMIGIVYSMIVLILFICIPMPFIKLFAHHDHFSNQFLHLVAMLLVIVAAGQVFDSIRSIAVGSLRGLNDTQFPLYVSLVGIWFIGLPLAYVFGFWFHWGVIGIALGHSVCLVFSALILWLRWQKKVAMMRTSLIN